jgi:peptide/nickel transport system substrate-binding protein
MTFPRRRRARLPALAAGALVLMALLAAALVAWRQLAPVRPLSGGRVSEALVLDGPLTLVPPFAETPNSRDVSGLLYRGLTRTGPDGRPVGELARSWSVDAAARNFTFHLRPGLRWSDGAPITSADAVYTLSVLQSDADARSASGQAWAGITASAPDALSVVYSLPQASPAFLALTGGGLLPQHALQPRSVKSLRATTDAPTSGPFTVASVEHDHVLLRRNRHAFEAPYLDELDLRLYDSRSRALQALLSGEVDIYAGLSPEDARHVGAAVNRRVITGSTFAYAELLFNQKTEALADDHLRRGLTLAIDRRDQVRGALAGYAGLDDSPIPPAVAWAALPGRQLSFDRAAAERELNAAGWALRGTGRFKDGKKLQLRLTTGDGQPYRAVAAAIRRDLAAVGVATTTQPLTQEGLLAQLQSHQFDIALTALDNGPDPDVYVFWHSSQTGPGGFNFSGMPASAALDRDLEAGRATADYPLRRQAYIDAQKQILEAHAAVFLYTPQALVGARDTLRGVALPTGGERYDRVQDWFVNSRQGF